ncbi:hypothetical protein PGTUg99_010614 [Puccinia graminis f. sp. tritici]|uniref:Uncharacterized protein n=1 Tax=Puccinia graminis f. sp. tritici TaxID=56615 RepID=A0A5B0RI28_PUCGR|nr:hypothetical protein PGTUg99_010614 [Puccinia graminis f. sp. tritici]
MEHGSLHYYLSTKNGIQPAFGRNEFSYVPTFCASNDPQQALEHLLHNHLVGPGTNETIDPIAVLQVEVAISILHGNRSPGKEEPPFNVYRFSKYSKPNLTDWRRFSDRNMKARNSENHD